MDAKYIAKTEALKGQLFELENKIVTPSEDETPLEFLKSTKPGQLIEITEEFISWVSFVEKIAGYAMEMQNIVGKSLEDKKCFICGKELEGQDNENN